MVFVASDADQSKMVLESAILVYGTKDPYSSQSTPGQFASVHEVRHQEEGPPIIMPGRAASHDALRAALGNLNGKVARKPMILSENLLGAWDGGLAAWIPPSRRFIFAAADIIGEAGGRELVHPGLIFIAGNGSMLVFAFKGGRRPTEETELFHAPYPNVYESGSLCTGNAAVPSSNEANPEPWIRMFFESRFTHYHNGLHVKYRGGNDAFFKAWWEGGWKTFPEKHLRPFGKTLGELISKGRAA